MELNQLYEANADGSRLANMTKMTSGVNAMKAGSAILGGISETAIFSFGTDPQVGWLQEIFNGFTVNPVTVSTGSLLTKERKGRLNFTYNIIGGFTRQAYDQEGAGDSNLTEGISIGSWTINVGHISTTQVQVGILDLPVVIGSVNLIAEAKKKGYSSVPHDLLLASARTVEDCVMALGKHLGDLYSEYFDTVFWELCKLQPADLFSEDVPIKADATPDEIMAILDKAIADLSGIDVEGAGDLDYGDLRLVLPMSIFQKLKKADERLIHNKPVYLNGTPKLQGQVAFYDGIKLFVVADKKFKFGMISNDGRPLKDDPADDSNKIPQPWVNPDARASAPANKAAGKLGRVKVKFMSYGGKTIPTHKDDTWAGFLTFDKAFSIYVVPFMMNTLYGSYTEPKTLVSILEQSDINNNRKPLHKMIPKAMIKFVIPAA